MRQDERAPASFGDEVGAENGLADPGGRHEDAEVDESECVESRLDARGVDGIESNEDVHVAGIARESVDSYGIPAYDEELNVAFDE